MSPINSSGVVFSADDCRSLERTRLRSLVERDMELARALHSPDFRLVPPGGNSRSRESYPAAVQTGAITYLKWQAADIMVRPFSDVVILRYQAAPEMTSRSGGSSSFACWHTDSYELRSGLWQVVLFQATRIGWRDWKIRQT